nr:DUF4142 domain-containing protein [Jiella sonneratiae]
MDTDKAPAPAPENVKSAKNFVPMAATGNTFEIDSSNLALTKSTDDAVRSFAKRMVEDHSDAATGLKEAVRGSKTDVAVPTGLDARHQQMMDTLNADDESAFDADYVAMQHQAHVETVALFEAYAKNGEDGPIRTFAEKTLPTLKEHLQMVEKLK